MSEVSSGADELSIVFARMSSLLLAQESLPTALRLVTELAMEAVPHTVASGMTLVSRQGHARTAVATDLISEQADALQYELNQGPCLTAWGTRSLVRVPDFTTETRWPEWTAAVRELALQSSISTPLLAGGTALGAIKCYAARPDVFDEHAERLLALFAEQAAVLVANVQAYEDAQALAAQLREALRTRDVIGQAKGILMATERVDEDTAFRWLVSASNRENRKVHDVAARLVQRYATRQS